MNKYKLYVSGTHCAACKILIEDILTEDTGITDVNVNLGSETVTLASSENNLQLLATRLSEKVRSHGYTLSLERVQKERYDTTELVKAIPMGLVLLALFVLIQKSGIVNLGVGGVVTPTTSFIIGLIASVSSCLAVVGGLVLSLSATVSQDDMGNKKPIIFFHIGRLISFTILGGLLGLLGHSIGINYTVSAILGILSAVVMILLGLNLLGILKSTTLTLPSTIFSFFRTVEKNTWSPLIIGFATFFLPCGFTQSMQIVALSSGSMIKGSLIMLSFALGTLPVLALLSFGSASLSQSTYAPLFFKSAGVFVIGLGVLGLLTGLAGVGIIAPLFTL